MPRKKIGVAFLLDPLESLHGPLKPPFLIAKELKESFHFIFASPMVSEAAAEVLAYYDFAVQNLRKRFHFSGSLLTFEAWLRKSKLRFKYDNYIVVNFSQCFLTNAQVYYAQGPIIMALDAMLDEMRPAYKLAYWLTRDFLARRDKAFIGRLRDRSQLVIANSKFCASMYNNYGFKVDEIIYPPLDCEQFKPTTSTPSGDYVLTYVGKETKYSVLKDVVRTGVKIKAFGAKTPYVPSYVLRQPNVEFLGKVSDEELVELYSNALYTLFAFTHEPFGYIPVESMGCGTPVLTYNFQGPCESVVHGSTGWLVDNDKSFADLAIEIWRKGYNSNTRTQCRERALMFDKTKIAEKWRQLLRSKIA
jgi:glycosyltransferase involved in cell wall biosynthesis